MVTTFELPGCHDMWTVISSEVKEDKKVPDPLTIFSTRLQLFSDPMYRRYHLQAEKSSESDEGAETEDGEDGEEKEEKQKDREEKTESPPEEDPKRHGFLILSREESTMVRKTLDTQSIVFGV